MNIVVISKGRTVAEIQEVYDAGCRDFGESRVAEALEKMEKLPKDIRWHFVGKLQRNKVNKIIGRFALIQSVDTKELAEKISEKSIEARIKSAILLEVNVSGETSKSGFSVAELRKEYPYLQSLQGIEIQGLMTMAPLTDDQNLIRACFSALRHLKEELQLPFLSMGMSQDYLIAIEEGATHLRIGSAIFEGDQ